MATETQKSRIIVNPPDYSGAGIYKIINMVNGKVYIGSSVNIRQRIRQHESFFRNGNCNQRFADDIKKGHHFTVEIVEKYDSITRYELHDREEYYVRLYDTYHCGYNTAVVPTYKPEYFRNNARVYDWIMEDVGCRSKEAEPLIKESTISSTTKTT